MNYFDPKSAAERYAKGRPYFHPQVIEKIKAYLAPVEPFERAIDVGCGTGLSTIALKEIAHQIAGTDISAEMIALAPADPQIIYYIAPAEELPVKDNDFDLMTLSSVFHWIDRSKFFKEARRVLRSKSWLVVYDNYFTAHMVENTAFQAWFQDTYIKKYPTPPRNRVDFGVEDSAKEGFHFLKQEQYQNSIKYSLKTLIDYLVTQSNIIAAVEGGNQTMDDVSKWLTESIQPIIGERTEATFIFGGPIWYLRKA
jgi:ubiquinone/menaquinone biosynthesis C-methylase UbiE